MALLSEVKCAGKSNKPCTVRPSANRSDRARHPEQVFVFDCIGIRPRPRGCGGFERIEDWFIWNSFGRTSVFQQIK